MMDEESIGYYAEPITDTVVVRTTTVYGGTFHVIGEGRQSREVTYHLNAAGQTVRTTVSDVVARGPICVR